MRSFSERFADRVKETGGGEIFMPGAIKTGLTGC